ncbi:hypothetical protein A7U60_g2432 [Sanghuangporus baumii]|uniref:RRM domain-containing protein n=1 Tax=Sanghuangporus baumii TaxID=108892 RepID=A0A9Q5NAL7_SANBA|nr:hypothetical protein A7U60_g2432 [Sanghuangporus baumii]
MLSEKVAIVDSSRYLTESEVYSLFANCGEILKIIPFDLPPGCLRDFPGLSHYFVEFEDEDAARKAIGVYVPPDVKVDPLHSSLGLLPLFESLQRTYGSSCCGSSSSSKRKATRLSAKKTGLQDRVAVVCCLKQYDESDLHSVFSTCGEIVKVHACIPGKSRRRRFFVEFAKTQDVECARRTKFPGFEVIGLAQNMQWMRSYKKCAKLGRYALSMHPQEAKSNS